MTFTRPLTLSRTCEALADREVHGLHAFGEHDLVDGTCGREGEERKKDKVRNEEACAAGRINNIYKIWEVTFTQTLPYPSRS